jgi:hypothetical protein
MEKVQRLNGSGLGNLGSEKPLLLKFKDERFWRNDG